MSDTEVDEAFQDYADKLNKLRRITITDNLAERYRDALSPPFKKSIELATSLLVRPCDGCSDKIQIGDQMIVTHGGPTDPQFYHQLCWHGEHKK